jgi:glycosyltransferase involved in cell wall biosynthesis
MQCGCPVVTSRDPAVTEVSGGAAIHANGALELAAALRSIASMPDLRAERKRAGLARASAFSWQATARATRSLYAELIGEPV